MKFVFISVYYCLHVSASVNSHRQTNNKRRKIISIHPNGMILFHIIEISAVKFGVVLCIRRN